MKTNDQAKTDGEREYSPETIRWFAALTAMTQLMCAVNGLRLHEERLAVTSPIRQTVALEFTGCQPFGFALTQGHQATFNVPSGHRFVIEQLSLSCWADYRYLRVRLETKSPRAFRTITLGCPQESSEPGLSCELFADAPMVVQGFSRSTFLFSNGEVENSATVPPQTYVRCGATWSRRSRQKFVENRGCASPDGRCAGKQ
jgi:hypothetical protein